MEDAFVRHQPSRRPPRRRPKVSEYTANTFYFTHSFHKYNLKLGFKIL